MATVIKRGAFWRAVIRRSGQTLTKTFDTKAEGEAWASAEEARIIAGATAELVAAMPSNISTAALFDRYALEISPNKGGGRWEVIRLRSMQKTLPDVAAYVDGKSLARWRDERLCVISASSVNRELNLISAVFNIAIKEWGLPIAVNPVRQIMRPRMPHARKRRVPDAERDAIIAALSWDGCSAPADMRGMVAWVFSVALETMMRQGEILHLRWGDVHLDRKFAHLPRTKNGDERDVPLSSRARALFELLPRGAPGNLVADINPGTFGVYFRRACKSAGVVGLHFHDSRREAITNAAGKIRDSARLARASGHRDPRSLMTYFRPDVSDLADELD